MRQEKINLEPNSVNSTTELMLGQRMLNKVPEVTIFFWIIKVLCTTVGETASDFLNVNLGFGLSGTAIIAGILLAIVLFFQLRTKKYLPAIYWLAVVLISIFGTLVTDIMTDSIGVPLEVSTIGFTIALMITFGIWYASEKTLSMHSIDTTKREVFYWLAILFTFALGTASGDLMAETLGLGYLVTGLIVVAIVVAISIAWKLGLDSVLGFWIVYIMTRPLGASLGDYLTQPPKYSGLGLGATLTTAIFLTAILFTVVFLSIKKLDRTMNKSSIPKIQKYKYRYSTLIQTMAVITVLALAAGTGYYFRHAQLVSSTATSTTTVTAADAVGDYDSFIKIEQDALQFVNAGDFASASASGDDLEYTWDQAAAKLRANDSEKWDTVDQTIDDVLRQLRAVNPDSASCVSALETSITAMK
ncbi:MAG: hypothetical protein CVV04_14330 [Firmicutes bacterium HGW-Firmicutes-9]|jgi:uncharacterized membrane-anchored protein|nr:MAG: hypothetical protein CVV04_14330 [Firmicutes bacterium HGW-Firmicutes-9]